MLIQKHFIVFKVQHECHSRRIKVGFWGDICKQLYFILSTVIISRFISIKEKYWLWHTKRLTIRGSGFENMHFVFFCFTFKFKKRFPMIWQFMSMHGVLCNVVLYQKNYINLKLILCKKGKVCYCLAWDWPVALAVPQVGWLLLVTPEHEQGHRLRWGHLEKPCPGCPDCHGIGQPSREAFHQAVTENPKASTGPLHPILT